MSALETHQITMRWTDDEDLGAGSLFRQAADWLDANPTAQLRYGRWEQGFLDELDSIAITVDVLFAPAPDTGEILHIPGEINADG